MKKSLIKLFGGSKTVHSNTIFKRSKKLVEEPPIDKLLYKAALRHHSKVKYECEGITTLRRTKSQKVFSSSARSLQVVASE